MCTDCTCAIVAVETRKKGSDMLDFDNFADQFPDPSKAEVLQILEKAKFALIELLSLQTINQSSTLLPVTARKNDEYIVIYVLACEYIYETAIPKMQSMLPPQFSDLVYTEISDWLPRVTAE